MFVLWFFFRDLCCLGKRCPVSCGYGGSILLSEPANSEGTQKVSRLSLDAANRFLRTKRVVDLNHI